jgi:hypothetical protein
VSAKRRPTEMIHLAEVLKSGKCPCCLKGAPGKTDIAGDSGGRRWVWRLCSRCAKRELARKPGEEGREEGPRAKRESLGRARAVAIVQWALGLEVDVEDVLGQAGRARGLRMWRLMGERPFVARAQKEFANEQRRDAIATFMKRRASRKSVEQASEGLTKESTEDAPFPTLAALLKAVSRTK